MADRTVARRYAKAFLDAAQEEQAVEMLLRDLDSFWALAAANDRELFRTLCIPVFTIEERKNVLDMVLRRLGVHSLTKNLLGLLIEKGRMAELALIVDAYHDMADARANRVKVIVETAAPLSEGLEAEVRDALGKLTGKQVILETRVNPKLIGGMVARVGGKVYDASVRSRLDDIRRRLVQAQAPAEA